MPTFYSADNDEKVYVNHQDQELMNFMPCIKVQMHSTSCDTDGKAECAR